MVNNLNDYSYKKRYLNLTKGFNSLRENNMASQAKEATKLANFESGLNILSDTKDRHRYKSIEAGGVAKKLDFS